MFVTPGVVVDGELVTTEPRRHQPRHPDPARQLLLRGLGRARRRSSTKDPLGNPVDKRHPWNQTTIPKPQKRDLDGGNYSLGDEPALVRQAHRRPPRARHRRRRARAPVGDGAGRTRSTRRTSRRPATSVQINLPKTPDTPEMRRSSGRSRSGPTRSSATARGSTSSPTRPAWRCTSSTRRSSEVRAGRHEGRSRTSTCPTRRSAAASTRRCAACSRTTW